MTLSLADRNVLILVANGFDENQLTEIQRALIKAQANIKTVAPEQGVVNGWQGEGWGHYFPVNSQIGDTLGSDYDIMVIPGGERGIAKLKANPHTRRIVRHFVDAAKPIAAIGMGVSLLALADTIADYTITAPAESEAEMKAAHVTLADEDQVLDRNILTSNGMDMASWAEAAVDLFGAIEEVSRAA